MATNETQPIAEYRCPGQSAPISRATHLGRLARFYPPCRQCPHRDDTGTLSPRHVKRLVETRGRGEPRSLFYREGAAGVYLNEFHAPLARDMAAALGMLLREPESRRNGTDPPVVVIAGDGRPVAPEMVAAVGEGLRWSGCNVIEIGEATGPCAALAVAHLAADGGIFVGNPGRREQVVGLRFWRRGGCPLSAGGALDRLERIFVDGADRPGRRFGALERMRVEEAYLGLFAPYYHALRPLRIAWEGGGYPVARYLEKLTRSVACELLPRGSKRETLEKRIQTEGAHLGVRLEQDGQVCRVWDEQGRAVAAERLFVVLGRHPREQQPEGPIVVEDEMPPAVGAGLGGKILSCDGRHAEMFRAMHSSGAPLGGGPDGRFWYAMGGTVLPDGLMTLTLLLEILSQSDRTLSQVVDAETSLA